MARPISSPESHRNGATADRHPGREDALRAAGLELLSEEDNLQNELGRLASESRMVRQELEGQLDATATTPGAAELERLRAENEQLAGRVADLERIAEEMQKEQVAWESRQREYEGLLEEKSEVIRELHRRLHEQPAERAQANPPREEELIALSEELERERRQLKDDEEALMQQMRQMEVQMSRERAEMARQRNEFQRLQNDVRHELELAARDATLRDRLAPLQRRHGDMMNRTGGQRSPALEAAPLREPASQPIEEAPGLALEKKDGSLFRRLFG
jgi:DNA repair exonuclease SbcCD ATPase subunit